MRVNPLDTLVRGLAREQDAADQLDLRLATERRETVRLRALVIELGGDPDPAETMADGSSESTAREHQ